MTPKREMMPVLSLGQNFRLAMTDRGLTFKDLSRMARVSYNATYRIAGKKQGPIYPTQQAVKIGAVLGFTRKQVEEKTRQDRLNKNRVYSKSEAFYRAVSELLELFESTK